MPHDPLTVKCPDCLAPVGEDCRVDNPQLAEFGHAGRRDKARAFAAEEGTCALCGQRMIRVTGHLDEPAVLDVIEEGAGVGAVLRAGASHGAGFADVNGHGVLPRIVANRGPLRREGGAGGPSMDTSREAAPWKA